MRRSVLPISITKSHGRDQYRVYKPWFEPYLVKWDAEGKLFEFSMDLSKRKRK